MKLKSTAACVLACLAASPLAIAQEGPEHRRQFGMLRYDANQDGQIARDEFQSALAAEFAARDGDGDGTITVEERRAGMQARMSEAMRQRFARLDENSDGNLTEEEFSARPNRQQAAGGPARSFGRMRLPGRAPGMQAADLSFDDFAAGRLAMFDQLDANDDQIVTQAELHAFSGKPYGRAARN